jgi:hypothetical protein
MSPRIPYALATALLLLAAVARAETMPAEEKDIQAALERINGPDPIQRVLAAEGALHSDNPLLRSLALQKTMESSDGRVKEVGFVYLVTIQKRFIATLEISSDKLEILNLNDLVKSRFLQLSPLTIVFESFDKNTLTVSGTADPPGASFIGSINQAGLIAALNIYGLNCKLEFRGVAGGALRGELTCRDVSFPARIPLP